MNKQIEKLEEQKKFFLDKATEAKKKGLQSQMVTAMNGYKTTAAHFVCNNARLALYAERLVFTVIGVGAVLVGLNMRHGTATLNAEVVQQPPDKFEMRFFRKNRRKFCRFTKSHYLCSAKQG